MIIKQKNTLKSIDIACFKHIIIIDLYGQLKEMSTMPDKKFAPKAPAQPVKPAQPAAKTVAPAAKPAQPAQPAKKGK